jgi:alkylhydroperoxidase family enzyme
VSRSTPAHRSQVSCTEEGTRLADANDGVSDETWALVRKHYDDDQTAALVSLVAMINATNRLGVIVNYQGGSYEPGMFGAALSS